MKLVLSYLTSILIGSVNDVRQLTGAPLMDYDAVEGAVLLSYLMQAVHQSGGQKDG